MPLTDAYALRKSDPAEYEMTGAGFHYRPLQGDGRSAGALAPSVFDYGNNFRGQALANGYEDAFKFDGFVPKYIRSPVRRRQGPLPLGSTLRGSQGHMGD